MIVVVATLTGSSPLTRGKPKDSWLGNIDTRLIPAHAGKTRRGACRSDRCTAHPRSRGENGSCTSTMTDGGGSSPLTRGKPVIAARWRMACGLIPAHAGKTYCQDCQALTLPAHPRSRGENMKDPSEAGIPAGSSPLTRGKLLYPEQPHVHSRLIPAHAGKTASPRSPEAWGSAHPRSRGENHTARRRDDHVAGSSPLTRGKPPRALAHKECDGLIPAHAGKTTNTRRPHSHSTAHPRSRGENAASITFNLAVRGSSPLTRGKLWHSGRSVIQQGLIPAHAGKTLPRGLSTSECSAHPRSRGENYRTNHRGYQSRGSSPLTRGKHVLRDRAHGRPGLIPAHAGKTATGSAETSTRRAHPRSRGENAYVSKLNKSGTGSSPLTRGKPPWPGYAPTASRLIPAHAGKTTCKGPGTRGDAAHPRSRGENL